MSEKRPEFEQPHDSGAEVESTADVLTLEEITAIFDDIKSDETEVVALIRQLSLEPIPDLDDPQAVAEYNEKMRLIKNLAMQHLGRANLLAELQEKIDEKIGSSSPDIDN